MSAKEGTVLVIGGTRYIGPFTTLDLLVAGYEVLVIDNLYNSSEESLNRIECICGKPLDRVFKDNQDIDSVIHLTAWKSAGESSEIPVEYSRVNVGGTNSRLHSIEANAVKNIVFSSSATIYGDATTYPNMIPVAETCPIGPTNPYGRTKMMIEMVIEDHVESHPGWNATLLKYFNPAGAHPSGLVGEDPRGVPYNLISLLGQVAVGRREKLMVFGKDYASHDGTAIRDYIHVVDLAKCQLAALNKVRKGTPRCRAWNLGTGRGSTVLEMIKAFSKTVGRDLPYEVVPRRKGDVLDLTAVPTSANEELGWKVEMTLEKACVDQWKWASYNPQWYRRVPPHMLLDALAETRTKLPL
ncbi:hypothetical protein HOY82DRAFT_547327 [Tuber indicum]|nr:hypothetical protein HOY82DRAFT_547327 [Tuber indicum]